MTNLVILLIDWGLNVAFWSSVTFLLGISIVWPWWKSPWGVNIMMLELAIMLTLLPVILSHDFGLHVFSNAAAAWIQAVSLWLVGIIIIWRGGMIITEQLRAAKSAQAAEMLSLYRDKILIQRENDNGEEKRCQQ